MRHRLQWFIHLRAHGLRKGDEHPTYTPHGVWHSYTFFKVCNKPHCYWNSRRVGSILTLIRQILSPLPFLSPPLHSFRFTTLWWGVWKSGCDLEGAGDGELSSCGVDSVGVAVDDEEPATARPRDCRRRQCRGGARELASLARPAELSTHWRTGRLQHRRLVCTPPTLIYTHADSDVISFLMYASWFPPPSCG